MAQKKRKKAFKEMKFRPNIADNDLNTKIKQIQKFLNKELQVRITVQMRGREITHKDIAYNLLKKIEVAVKGIGRMDKNRREQGRTIQTMISPFKRK